MIKHYSPVIVVDTHSWRVQATRDVLKDYGLKAKIYNPGNGPEFSIMAKGIIPQYTNKQGLLITNILGLGTKIDGPNAQLPTKMSMKNSLIARVLKYSPNTKIIISTCYPASNQTQALDVLAQLELPPICWMHIPVRIESS